MQLKFLSSISDSERNHFVYLLLSRCETKFKIGATKSPFNRIVDLGGRKKFDDQSIIFSVGSRGVAYGVENHLHQVFSKYRIDSTEWFLTGKEKDHCVFHEAEAYLIFNRISLGRNVVQDDAGCWNLQDFYAGRPMTHLKNFDF